MRRREFIAALGGMPVAWLGVPRAQGSKPYRLAICSPFEPTALMTENSANRYYGAFIAELRRLGHVEGENLIIDRYGKEQAAAGPAALVGEVVRSNPDVVYAIGPSARLFKVETTTIPVVALMGDPIAQGLVQSLARPGGNITGVSIDTGPSIHGKRIQLLRELVPSLSKLAYMDLRLSWENYFGPPVRAACEAEGISLVTVLLDLPTNDAAYSEAVATAVRGGANAIDVAENPDAMTNRSLIVNLIGRARLPAMYGIREFVDDGGLMAYAYDLIELNRRAAHNVSAILRGTKPADIPVFQSSRFELSINLQSAKALGLTVPQALLARADEVIE